ncbi:MAG: hypothetical protein U9P70_01490 [Patescibacteria group bacterium]|nr:hypothetical protein [Patescibacteria group bacterium]
MNYQDENKIYEGYIVEKKNDSFVVFKNNKRVPIFVGLCAILIIFGLVLFYVQLMDLMGLVIILFIAGMFIFIGLRNRKNVSVMHINNNSVSFPIYSDYLIKIESIKNIEVKIETKFNFNLLGLFVSYPYRIIFNLNDGSSIDTEINFGFEKNARNFLEFLKEILRLRNVETKQNYNFTEKVSRKTATICLLIGLVLIGVNYFILVFMGYVVLWLIISMPVTIFLGILGIINPKTIKFKNSNSNYESSNAITLVVSIIGAVVGLAIYYFLIY